MGLVRNTLPHVVHRPEAGTGQGYSLSPVLVAMTVALLVPMMQHEGIKVIVMLQADDLILVLRGSF